MDALPSASMGTGGVASIPAASRLVIDAPTRMFNWLFALSFVGAYSDRQPSGTPQGPTRQRASFRWVTPNRAPPAARRWSSRG
jgi:hypothetical protein